MSIIAAGFVVMLLLVVFGPRTVIHAQCGRCGEPILWTRDHFVHEFDGRTFRTDEEHHYIVASHAATP